MPPSPLYVEAHHLRVVMAEETVEEVLARIVRRVTKKSDVAVTGDTTFTDLKADSLDRIQILIALEDAFDILLPEEEVAKVCTMGEFVALVKRKISEKAGS